MRFSCVHSSINWFEEKFLNAYTGADLGFSRVDVADFEIFVDLFFRSTNLIFRALPKRPWFGQVFCAAGKIAFFRRELPLKLVWICAKGAFRKIFGPVSQIWISWNSSKGYERVGRGSIPWEKAFANPHPPKSAPVPTYSSVSCKFGTKTNFFTLKMLQIFITFKYNKIACFFFIPTFNCFVFKSFESELYTYLVKKPMNRTVGDNCQLKRSWLQFRLHKPKALLFFLYTNQLIT